MLSAVLLFCISNKLGSLTDICYRCSQIEKHVVVSTFSTATGGRGCGGVICHTKKFNSTFWTKVWTPLPPHFPPRPFPQSNILEHAPGYYKQLFYFKVRQSLLKFATTGITKCDDYCTLHKYTLATLFCKSYSYFEKGCWRKCLHDNHERQYGIWSIHCSWLRSCRTYFCFSFL